MDKRIIARYVFSRCLRLHIVPNARTSYCCYAIWWYSIPGWDTKNPSSQGLPTRWRLHGSGRLVRYAANENRVTDSAWSSRSRYSQQDLHWWITFVFDRRSGHRVVEIIWWIACVQFGQGCSNRAIKGCKVDIHNISYFAYHVLGICILWVCWSECHWSGMWRFE